MPRNNRSLKRPRLRPAKRRREAERQVYYADAEEEGSESEESSSGQGDTANYVDLAEAQSRLDQFVMAGAISLVGEEDQEEEDLTARVSPFKKLQDSSALVIEMANDLLDLSENDCVFKCTMCQTSLDSSSELHMHELSEHFAWVFKPLLMQLLDIIGDESYHCPSSSCSLRLQLVKCVNSHQTCCPECHFTSNCSSTLMEHYKVIANWNTDILYFCIISLICILG